MTFGYWEKQLIWRNDSAVWKFKTKKPTILKAVFNRNTIFYEKQFVIAVAVRYRAKSVAFKIPLKTASELKCGNSIIYSMCTVQCALIQEMNCPQQRYHNMMNIEHCCSLRTKAPKLEAALLLLRLIYWWLKWTHAQPFTKIHVKSKRLQFPWQIEQTKFISMT